MAISVNPQTFVITVPQSDLTLSSGTLYTYDTNTFRLALKDWEDDEGGIIFPKTHDHNTEVTIAGVTYARFLEMLPPYSITFEDGQYSVILEKSNNNIWDIAGGILNQNQVQVIPTNAAGLIVVTQGSGVTEQDKTDIADQVWNEDLTTHITPDTAAVAMKSTTYRIGSIVLDSAHGTAGTGWPIGTHYKPSNNLTDTLTIMGYGNVDDLVLHTNTVVEAGHNVSNIVVRTEGRMGIDVTLTEGCSANRAAFRNVNLQGALTNGDQLLVEDCSINNLSGFKGIMNVVAFNEGSEVSFSGWATIIDGTGGGEPTNEVEFGIGTASVNVVNWNGNLKLTNKTGDNRTVLNCNSGNIIIDSTCVSGSIQLLGTGTIEADNSGPNCNVDTDAFITTAFIADAVWDEDVSGHMGSTSFGALTQRMAGLIHENTYIDQPVYDTNTNLTSARVRIYSVAGSVGTNNDVIGSYTITAPGDGAGKFTSWKMVKV